MICFIKKSIKSISDVYQDKSQEIINFLDRELLYEQSLKYYTDQQKITKLKMEYKEYAFSDEIHSLSSMPEPAIEEIIRINKRITDKTWGVILESEKVQNLNVYIAQMNKVQINSRKSNFFVVTDSHDIMLELNDVFNWMNKIFYIVPNTYDLNIEKEYRPSINFHCLKHLEKHISTPGSSYSDMLKSIGGIQVTVPNSKRVFSFNCKRLVPQG
jgi:hypothetical protein